MTASTPCRFASAAAASSDTAAEAMTCTSLPAKRGSSGRGASASGEFEMRHHRRRQLHAVGVDEGQRVGAAAGVRHGRPGGDQRRVVARNVRDDQRHHLCRPGRRGQPAALDGRDMLADRVHRRDRRAGGKQRLVDGDLVGERQAWRRRGQQRRAAAGDQRNDQIVGGQARKPSPAAASTPSRPAASGTGCAASMISMRSHGAA